MDPIERIIKQAQERGEFDNLPGAGKPQDLRENPWVPPDWRMAYRMLESNGFAPEVVEDDKVLRSRIAELETSLDRFARRWHAWTPAERRARLAARATFLREYEAGIRAINSTIHVFNMRAPRLMQRGTLPRTSLLETANARLDQAGA